MSNLKMREALQECVNGLDDVMLEIGYNALLPEFSRACEALRKGREALAQQPVAGVELTDDELAVAAGCRRLGDFALKLCRNAIAAHEAKKSGGGV